MGSRRRLRRARPDASCGGHGCRRSSPVNPDASGIGRSRRVARGVGHRRSAGVAGGRSTALGWRLSDTALRSDLHRAVARCAGLVGNWPDRAVEGGASGPTMGLLDDAGMATKALRTLTASVLAGAIATVLVSVYAGFLRTLTSEASSDVLHFSLHPFDPSRLAAAFGLILLHVGVIWGAAVPTRLLAVGRRHAQSRPLVALIVAGWAVGALLGAWLGVMGAGPLPIDWLLLAAGASGLAAVSMGPSSSTA